MPRSSRVRPSKIFFWHCESDGRRQSPCRARAASPRVFTLCNRSTPGFCHFKEYLVSRSSGRGSCTGLEPPRNGVVGATMSNLREGIDCEEKFRYPERQILTHRQGGRPSTLTSSGQF